MPQSGLNYERREHPHWWRSKRLVSKDNTSTGLINGMGGIRTSEAADACTWHGPTPPRGLNGYIKHNYKSKGTKEKPLSATNEVAAGSAGGALDVGVNGVAHSYEFHRVEPDPGSLTSKHNRRGKTFKHQKKTWKHEIPPAGSTSPVMQSKEEENWENEIREVTLHNWDEMCFGVNPYGNRETIILVLRI
ncbi:uncharacterized protein LOC112157217 isoform X2 [Oryzias melastigma]|uniref:uncharacterized protein LOC112157217 isoform X2 n=1 Tax=Oryzias melastigma TaxID=30732 RepID=UPI000CF811A3|nr:uncharacterized protein LOC112157217 isoform X2 [Oryzias melastigma]